MTEMVSHSLMAATRTVTSSVRSPRATNQDHLNPRPLCAHRLAGRRVPAPVCGSRAHPGGDEAVLAQLGCEPGEAGERAGVVGVDEQAGLVVPLRVAVMEDPHRAQPG